MGSLWSGNVTPSASSTSLHGGGPIVFESGLPITMVGPDLTHQAKATLKGWSGSAAQYTRGRLVVGSLPLLRHL